MAHFIFLWLVSVTLGYFSLCSLCSVPPAPPPPFTLFTDYLTIQVLNKNEVRKWFEDYRSCRTCWTTNFVKEQVTKKKCVHFKIIDLHSFCIFGYKVGWFHSFPPLAPLRKNIVGGMATLIHQLNLHEKPSAGSLKFDVDGWNVTYQGS